MGGKKYARIATHAIMPTVAELCSDLAAEQADLDRVLSLASPQDWTRPTPAAGWDVRDSLSHLCFFEEAGVTSLIDPGAFESERDQFIVGALDAARVGAPTPDVALGRGLGDPLLLLQRWRAARAAYQSAAAQADPAVRVAWYGPAMSLASFTTARLMEAWAHGVDIKDALGQPVEAGPRLRHVCHIGFAARSYAFASHGVEDPGNPVRLHVDAPDGGVWSWGPPEAADVISGPALDVALVFTQRRHHARTAVLAVGSTAQLWLSIAQAFAGPGTVTEAGR